MFWAWGGSDPARALEGLLRLPENFKTDRAFAELAGGATRRSAETALALLTDIPKQHHPAFLAKVIEQEAYNNQNPLAAAAIATRLPPGNISDHAYRELAKVWSRHDVAQAADWVTGLPPSRSRDYAASAISMNQRESDPEAATVWGTLIDDPDMRHSFTKDAFSRWFKSSPETAANWLVGTDRLTGSEKDRVVAASVTP